MSTSTDTESVLHIDEHNSGSSNGKADVSQLNEELFDFSGYQYKTVPELKKLRTSLKRSLARMKAQLDKLGRLHEMKLRHLDIVERLLPRPPATRQRKRKSPTTNVDDSVKTTTSMSEHPDPEIQNTMQEYKMIPELKKRRLSLRRSLSRAEAHLDKPARLNKWRLRKRELAIVETRLPPARQTRKNRATTSATTNATTCATTSTLLSVTSMSQCSNPEIHQDTLRIHIVESLIPPPQPTTSRGKKINATPTSAECPSNLTDTLSHGHNPKTTPNIVKNMTPPVLLSSQLDDNKMEASDAESEFADFSCCREHTHDDYGGTWNYSDESESDDSSEIFREIEISEKCVTKRRNNNVNKRRDATSETAESRMVNEENEEKQRNVDSRKKTARSKPQRMVSLHHDSSSSEGDNSDKNETEEATMKKEVASRTTFDTDGYYQHSQSTEGSVSDWEDEDVSEGDTTNINDCYYCTVAGLLGMTKRQLKTKTGISEISDGAIFKEIVELYRKGCDDRVEPEFKVNDLINKGEFFEYLYDLGKEKMKWQKKMKFGLCYKRAPQHQAERENSQPAADSHMVIMKVKKVAGENALKWRIRDFQADGRPYIRSYNKLFPKSMCYWLLDTGADMFY